MTIRRSLSTLMFADVQLSARVHAVAVPRPALRPGAAALAQLLEASRPPVAAGSRT